MNQDPETIDFSAYGGREISLKIAEILSVVDRVKIMLASVILTLICIQAYNFTIHLKHDDSLLLWLATSGYLLVGGLILGVLIGLLVVSLRLSGNVIQLLQLLLKTVRMAASDQKAIEAGDKRLPEAPVPS